MGQHIAPEATPLKSPLVLPALSTTICFLLKNGLKQASAELGQAQVRLDDIVEVVNEVVVKAVVIVEV